MSEPKSVRQGRGVESVTYNSRDPYVPRIHTVNVRKNRTENETFDQYVRVARQLTDRYRAGELTQEEYNKRSALLRTADWRTRAAMSAQGRTRASQSPYYSGPRLISVQQARRNNRR